MVTATLTTKGQLTIPKAVRESLHLKAGDQVMFSLHDDSEVVLKPMNKSVEDVFGMLHRPGETAKTVEEMNAAVAESMKAGKICV